MTRIGMAGALLGVLACSAAPTPVGEAPGASLQLPAPACRERSKVGEARFDMPDTLPAGRPAEVRMTDVRTTTAATLTVHLMGPSGQVAKFPVGAVPAYEDRWLLGCDWGGDQPPEPPTCRAPLQPGQPEGPYVTSFELAPDLLAPGRYALYVCGPLDVPPHVFDVL